MHTAASLKSRLAALGAAVTTLVSAPLHAHHSFAMYDQTKQVTHTGRLIRFIPGANHAQLLFEIVGDDGKPAVGADGKPFGAFAQGGRLIRCGAEIPAGGCTAETGETFLASRD